MRILCSVLALVFWSVSAFAQTYVLRPDRVFDGEAMHEGWVVVVAGERIASPSKTRSGRST